MRLSFPLVLLGLLSACVRPPLEERREPPPVDPVTFAAEFEEWRRDQDAMLRDPSDSSLAYVGLWPLAQGRTRFGSDAGSEIPLPPPAPALAGTFVRTGDTVTIEPPAGVTLKLGDGKIVAGPMPAVSDRARGTTEVAIGSLRVVLHEEPGPSYWIRLIDRASPRLAEFSSVPVYAPAVSWRVAAQFEPFAEPRTVEVPDVSGGTQRATAPGMLRFQIGDATYRLMALTTGHKARWSIAFKDRTNRTDTYGGGRYLTVDVPDATGWTVIDFNRARNPPCAYSAFTVCQLPPPSNRLALDVTAGQKRPAK